MTDLLSTGFPLVDDTRYFMSGANRPSEIHAICQAGGNPGVCAQELSEEAIKALCSYKDCFTKVFIDSGAFSEVEFKNGRPVIMRPIPPTEWEYRLDTYERLARVLGPQLYCVAPDCVGFQGRTLERIGRHWDRLARLRHAGAHLIVPLQRGRYKLERMADKVTEILDCGPRDVIWGLPMRKGATPKVVIAKFTDWLFVRPFNAVHLLGMGVYSPEYLDILGLIMTRSPGTVVFSDSARLRQIVGHTNGPGHGPRAFTRAFHQPRLGDKKPLSREAALKRVLFDEIMARERLARDLGWYDEDED